MASTFIYRNKIYMSVQVNGKQRKRSTGLNNTKKNLKYVERELLPNFIIEVSNNKSSNVKLFYYIERFKEEKKHFLKERTYIRYCKMIDKWILPEYGKMKIKDIKISTLKQFLNNHFEEGKTAKTVELYRTVFSGILQEAVYDGVLSSNLFKNIKHPKKKKPVITPFSVDEVKLLLDNSFGWFHNYIGIATSLGLRSGELIALKWIDIGDKEIYIRRTRDFNQDTTPKTESSIRTLPMFAKVREFIDKQRKISGHSEYVFPRPNGLPWSDTQWIAQNHWYPLLKDLALKKRRLYEMRHTFATNMLNSGHFKVTEIARMLGHTTTEYLFNVYSAYIESEKNSFSLNINIYE
ncbi:site-specific integrase [Arcobacter sp. F155]|uniref:tyrosine-type recombinase/integrase n=1 Tax=Arcobacter sp. F155 TaxID=2044512 RepID=UPI0013E927DB|nr:site-specific integrase [Arcobacter sp. F155]